MSTAQIDHADAGMQQHGGIKAIFFRQTYKKALYGSRGTLRFAWSFDLLDGPSSKWPVQYLPSLPAALFAI
ncbi:hypothetical protein [Hylemonella gracilis]|uniref:hypothetical protein n=1 Tax=Hylemonella gracilis TaxID=80880 RepID=UPI0012DD7498|nr:hypothetical protein [Hylemonella gracilis]